LSQSLSASRSHTENTQSDKLQLLYHQSFQAVFFSLVAALIYTAILWRQPDHQLLLVWLAVILMTSLLRLALFISYRCKKPDKTAVLKWQHPYYISLMLSSLSWGTGTLIICMDKPLLFQIITYCFLLGMAAAALSVYSSIRYMSVSTITVMLVPITAWFTIHPDTTANLMAVAGVFFLISTLRATSILADTLHNSFMLTHKLKLAYETAEHLARTDMLTGLNNRRAFIELSERQLSLCKRNNTPASLLVLDLDHFKTINDELGHATGDFALQHFSELLQKSVRSSDICARIGGEEFALLLPNTGLSSAHKVAEKLRMIIASEVINTADNTFSISTSIGIASGQYELDVLLQTADMAMYEAKQSGRNQVKLYTNEQPVSENNSLALEPARH